MAPPSFPLPGPTHSLIVDPPVSLSHTPFPQTNLVSFKIIPETDLYIYLYLYIYDTSIQLP